MIPNNDNFWLRQTPHITSIATLGPEGSSSQCAARYLSSLIGEQLEILLFSTFEQASEHVEYNDTCLLLVANAYQRVDNFYMNNQTLLLGSFFCSIKPKRYRIVDLQEHRFIDGTGEVTDF